MNGVKADMVKRPFIEHVRELQIRLTWCAAAVAAGGFGAYMIHPSLLELIRRPLGQALYYTSPVGGFNFIFKLCFVTGIIVALPVILYHCFSFAGPLINKARKKLIISFAAWSFILAIAGVLFGYFISLPAALHFLTAFGGDNIQSLIRADEYFNFALAYIAGFALIFQVPVVMLFINRIKPLPPGIMMKSQRYVILASFILSAILTPTPDPVNQAIMALPMVFLYQIGIVLVWLINRNKTNKIYKPSSHYSEKTAMELNHNSVLKPLVAENINAMTGTSHAPATYHKPRQTSHRQIMDIAPLNRQKPIRYATNNMTNRPNISYKTHPRLTARRVKMIDMVLS